MAKPIPLELPPGDPREALNRRLENAPREHAEALLAAYEVLQGLHDRGVLELLRGALGSGDQILEILVDASKTPEAIRGIRNLMILARMAGSFDPEVLEGISRGLSEGLAQGQAQKPPGRLSLLKKLGSQDTRRALTALTVMLESMGKSLDAGKKSAAP